MDTIKWKTSQGGTALVLTLWLLALVSALALSFALSARTGSAITRNFKESVVLRAMAVDAIENTVAYLLADPDTGLDYVDGEGKLRTDRDRPPASGIITSGQGTVYLTLSAEDARINVNEVNVNVLRRLFDNMGAEQDNDTMASSLMDWIDPDDLHRLNGAEDSYYRSLGYKTSGAPIEVVDELMLIKGFDREKLQGSDESKGVSGLITTFAHSININAAPYEVLRVLGLDAVHANTLISERATSQGRTNIPSGLPQKATLFSSVFRIEAQAALEGSPQVYHITSIVKRTSGQGGQTMKTLYWKENIEAGGA